MSGRAVVIGLGRSGLACARVLNEEGFAVTVVDRDYTVATRERAAQLPPEIEVILGGYPEQVALGADLVCPSPEIPYDAPELELARSWGIPVHSEMDLVYQRCPAPIIGVTGTHGKATTAGLIAAMLRTAGRHTHLGDDGNVPMLDRLTEVSAYDWVVLPLSSYQIESITAPHSRIAAVLNLAFNHADRHGSVAAYRAIKERLVKGAEGAVILGADDPQTRGMAAIAGAPVRLFGTDLGGADGATVDDGDVVVIDRGMESPILTVSDIPLLGSHNLANVLAAVAVGRAAGIDHVHIATAVRDFPAPGHHLEPVVERAGVLWVDDSSAITVDAAVTALHAFDGRSGVPARPIVWIGGGKNRGHSLEALVDAVADRARCAILTGTTAVELDRALAVRGHIERVVVDSVAEAVSAAAAWARSGDVVLFSPGCSSRDQFADFEERGQAFTAAVRRGPH